MRPAGLISAVDNKDGDAIILGIVIPGGVGAKESVISDRHTESYLLSVWPDECIGLLHINQIMLHNVSQAVLLGGSTNIPTNDILHHVSTSLTK